MPKISGYKPAKDWILSYIMEKSPKTLERAWIATELEISISTSGNYLQMLATEYPNSLSYARGILSVFNPIPVVDLPSHVRLQAKEAQIKQVKELTNRILKNHLKHSDKKKLEEALTQLKQRIDNL